MVKLAAVRVAVGAYQVGVNQVAQGGGGGLLGLDLGEAMKEAEHAPKAGLDVAEVVRTHADAEIGQAVGIGWQVKPTIGRQ
jgi:hypothetical protein